MNADEVIAEQNKKIEKLTAAIEQITKKPEPERIELSFNGDSSELVYVDPARIARGEVLVVPKPEMQAEKKLEANQIRRSDHAKIAQHIQEIGSGAMVIVD